MYFAKPPKNGGVFDEIRWVGWVNSQSLWNYLFRYLGFN